MAEIILAEQTLSGFALIGGTDYGLTAEAPGALTTGETYTVLWDGEEYTCVAYEMMEGSGVVAIGNLASSPMHGTDTGEPFLIAYGSASITGESTDQFSYYTQESDESHTVAIYKGALEQSGYLIENQMLDFTLDSETNLYGCNITDAIPSLTAGNTYTVIWDETRYVVTAEEMTNGMVSAVAMGNAYLGGLGEDTGEPFVFAYFAVYQSTAIYTSDTSESHTVSVYAGTLEEEEPEAKGANIVLYDRNGNPVTYEGIETVTFNTDKEGETATYTHGTAVDEEPVTLDFSAGNQTVKPTDADMMKSAVIEKPEGLAPENIKKGVEIAGITGEMIGTGVSKEVELNLADGDQTVQADPETLMSEVVIKKPDALLPENIASGVNIAGVVGNAALADFDTTDEYLKYFTFSIDGANKSIILCSILYDVIYSETGSYDVTVPDTIGGYNVIIKAG